MNEKSENQIYLKLQARLNWLYHFLVELFRQFIHGRGFKNAASLSYTTLLSIVPLIAVMFSLFSHLPVFKDIEALIQDFVFSNFVPSFGRSVQNYLIEFSFNASQLTSTGLIFLFIVALLLMSNIDTALNNIWHVTKKRKMLYRFLVYWAILTLGPVLLGAGLYSTSYLLASPLLDDVNSSLMLKARLLTYLPFITTSIAFSIVYLLVPNAYVNLKYSLVGGITAAILFEMAKFAFGIYVKAMPTYQMIYGAFAVIPMFLIWIYVSWIIVLFGGQIAYALSVFKMKGNRVMRAREHWDFFDVYRIIGELWLAQDKGVYLSEIDLKKKGVNLSHASLNQVLELLDVKNWICRDDGGHWILTRDVNKMTLNDIYEITKNKIPDKIWDKKNRWQKSLQSVINDHHQNQVQQLDKTLGELFLDAVKE